MANVDLSDLSQLTTPADDDKLLVTDDSEAVADKSKYITYLDLYTHILGMSDSHRSQFVYKDADEIYLGAARYYHNGTVAQLLYWDSQLTYAFSNLAAGDWCFLYIDDSAVVTADTNLLTATEFTDSTTAPSWSATKHGFYNGEDRCIFAVYSASDSVPIREFVHSGNFVAFASDIQDVNEGISTSWESHTLSIPDFCTQAQVTFEYKRDGGTSSKINYRPNGTSGTGLLVSSVRSDSYISLNTVDVVTDSSQIIQLADDTAATGNTMKVYTGGWYFPVGM